MNSYLYMTVFPEALVVSMLPPEEFGTYLTSGSRKCFHGRTMFFEIDRAKLSPFFDRAAIDSIKPHPDGSPKQSLTVAVYRVLEHIPMAAFGRLFLVTRDGKHIFLLPQPYANNTSHTTYLYQELCPLRPTIVSKLAPDAFRKSITNPKTPVYVPRLLFVDLLLGQIADPQSNISAGMLPYSDMGNIRDAVNILSHANRDTLIVDRAHTHDFFYRTIGHGFFIGDENELVFYKFPSTAEREEQYYNWWRSAELS